MKTEELFAYDRSLNESVLCGVDEAGRGPLAGPVVVCACVMPNSDFIDGVNDSKKISEAAREKLYERIIKTAVCYEVCVADNAEIDRLNILRATLTCMVNAVNGLKTKPSLVLVDGNIAPEVRFPVKTVIKGDGTSYSIAAASIIAKVTRDRMMREYDLLYPQYGFAKHKGYGTKQHIEAIKLYGKCPIHRDTFIKKFVG